MNKHVEFVSVCEYLCIVLTGGVLSTSPTQVEKIPSLLEPGVDDIMKWGDATRKTLTDQANVTERCGVLRGGVSVTGLCHLFCQ